MWILAVDINFDFADAINSTFANTINNVQDAWLFGKTRIGLHIAINMTFATIDVTYLGQIGI